jgi:dihydrofolate reductase
MRRLVLQMGVSLDGIVAGGPKGQTGLGDAEHPDVKAWKLESLRGIGTHIMGRVTYEEMAAHWPGLYLLRASSLLISSAQADRAEDLSHGHRDPRLSAGLVAMTLPMFS